MPTCDIVELVICREGTPDSSWTPVYCVALVALENEALNLLCHRLSFPEPKLSLRLLAGSLLGDIIACSYAAAEPAAGLQVCCHLSLSRHLLGVFGLGLLHATLHPTLAF